MTIDQQIEELQRLLAEAEPAPWVASDEPDVQAIWTGAYSVSAPRNHDATLLYTTRGGRERTNAALIAAAVNALPLLLDEVGRLREAEKTEKERASVLLEATWETIEWYGVGDAAVDEKLVPAVLKADGDPDYARARLAELGASQALKGGVEGRVDTPSPTGGGNGR